MNTHQIIRDISIGLVALLVFQVNIPSVSAVVEETTPTVLATPSTTPRTYRAGTTVREQALEKAKEVVSKLFTNQYISRLENVKARIETNQKIGSSAKQELLQKIEEEIAWFTTQKTAVENATTLEQVKTIAQQARERFKTLAGELRRLTIAGGYVTSLEKVVKNMKENILPRADAALTRLASKGVDVTVARNQLDLAEAEVIKAEALIPQLRDSTSAEQAKTLFEQAKNHIKTARDILKDMIINLQAAAKALKTTE